MKKLALLAVAMCALMACHRNQTVGTPAEELIARMGELSHKGMIYGHQDDPFYGITWMWEDGRSDTYELLGDYPGVMGFDLGGLEEKHDKNLDSVPFTWIRREAIAHVARGGIITFSWHPRNPRTGGNAWDVSDKTVVRNILPGGEQHALFTEWMDDVSSFLETLTDEEGNPIAFIFRPWHEYNGSWFWWGQDLCSDEEYLALWTMLQDYMNERMPGQIVWAQSPNLQGNWTDETFLPRFAGKERVDLLGEDCYQWGDEESFMTGAKADVQYLSSLAHANGMLFAITECGRVNSDIPDWWSRIFLPVTEGAEACYCLPWRNWHKEHFGVAKETTTAEDVKALYEQGKFLLLGDMK